MGLPDGTVIDGELLAWQPEQPLPMPFTALQTRIQRLKPGPKTLAAAPARVVAYDLLELDGEDLRERPLHARRALLDRVLATLADPRIIASPLVQPTDWQAAAQVRLMHVRAALKG